ncbi:hypothetical protein J14TS5_52870 [Paenibacillus lautus]|nr:hypothetical protein J14TS5_52870 [Paenibacillus lautus]
MIMAPFKDININIIIKEPYEIAITNMPAGLLSTNQKPLIKPKKEGPTPHSNGSSYDGNPRLATQPHAGR